MHIDFVMCKKLVTVIVGHFSLIEKRQQNKNILSFASFLLWGLHT